MGVPSEQQLPQCDDPPRALTREEQAQVDSTAPYAEGPIPRTASSGAWQLVCELGSACRAKRVRIGKPDLSDWTQGSSIRRGGAPVRTELTAARHLGLVRRDVTAGAPPLLILGLE